MMKELKDENASLKRENEQRADEQQAEKFSIKIKSAVYHSCQPQALSPSSFFFFFPSCCLFHSIVPVLNKLSNSSLFFPPPPK